MIEKYGVKVKQPSLACAEIQETVFAGDTTSMLQNLKKLNSNLRKCSNLQCIIKKGDKKPDSSQIFQENRPPTGAVRDPFEVVTPRIGVLGSKQPESLNSGRNPFLELVNQASFGTN